MRGNVESRGGESICCPKETGDGTRDAGSEGCRVGQLRTIQDEELEKRCQVGT